MSVDWSALERAKSLITPEPLGADYLVIVHRLGHIDVAVKYMDPDKVPAGMRRALSNFSPLWDDFSALLTLVFRMERDLEHRDKGQLDDFSWLSFSRLDVEMFFVQFRSLFDHLAGIVRGLSTAPDSTPDTFGDLRVFAADPKRNAILPARVRELVDSCTWFEELRDARDALVHKGGLTMTLMAPGQLAFQLFDRRLMGGINIPSLMVNENVVDFRLFGAAYLSRLLVLLDELALIAMEVFSIEDTGIDPRTSNGGIHYLNDWFDRLSNLRPQGPSYSSPET